MSSNKGAYELKGNVTAQQGKRTVCTHPLIEGRKADKQGKTLGKAPLMGECEPKRFYCENKDENKALNTL